MFQKTCGGFSRKTLTCPNPKPSPATPTPLESTWRMFRNDRNAWLPRKLWGTRRLHRDPKAPSLENIRGVVGGGQAKLRGKSLDCHGLLRAAAVRTLSRALPRSLEQGWAEGTWDLESFFLRFLRFGLRVVCWGWASGLLVGVEAASF